MASPDQPDETAGATAPAQGGTSSGARPPLPVQQPMTLPVYRPRRRRVVWSFAVAFVLAATVSAVLAWLLLR